MPKLKQMKKTVETGTRADWVPLRYLTTEGVARSEVVLYVARTTRGVLELSINQVHRRHQVLCSPLDPFHTHDVYTASHRSMKR